MAKVKKIRKEKLSIYLARDGSKPDSDVIKLENAKQPIEMDLPEAESARLYIKKQPPKNSPPWTRLFTTDSQVDVSEFGTSSNVGVTCPGISYH